MKKMLQCVTFLVAGMLIFSACTEEKTGKSPEQIADIMNVDPEGLVKDIVPSDSIIQVELVVVLPPPVIEPMPPEPYPDPVPNPIPPQPGPVPYPIPPPPFPEPEPIVVEEIVELAEVEAIFPGGNEAMMKFISDNVKYPEIDRGLGNQGRVYVRFVVEKDGSLSNLKIMRGVSETIDREAKRVIRLMPKWTPGEIRGKAVRSRSLLPIKFTLEEAGLIDSEPLKVTPMIDY
ncbi:MAG: energy transducer TonB [Crocinitomicaceae bacterium]|nr:energy transducer TonB [Flavobacteriales bacterium]NQZ37673.1 energy transducer TonB [Crocinitomicaceae bacterium]